MNSKLEQFSTINPNPVLSVEKDGTVLYSNEAGESLLLEWGVRFGEKLPAEIVVLVQRVILRNSPEKVEAKVGNRVFSVTFQPVSEEGSVNIYGFDISYQKKLEQKIQLQNEELEAKTKELIKANKALKNSESKYQHIIDNAQEGIWIIDLDDRTVFVNQKVSEMLGYKIDEIIGQSPQKFLMPEFRAVADYRLREHRKKAEQAINYRFLRRDGSELFCKVSTFQLLDDEGKYAGSLGMLIDITECKQLEEALINHESKFKALFDLLPIGVSITDNKRNILDANTALEKIMNVSKSDLFGGKNATRKYIRSDGTLMASEDFPSSKALKDIGSIQSSEIGVIKEDGSIIWTDVSAVALPFSNGEAVIVTRDITENKKMQEALKRTNDTLEEQVKERTAELERAYNSLKESERRLAEAQKMAHVGFWERNLVTGGIYWSNEMYRIFKRDPQEPPLNLDEFLKYVHPEDRDTFMSAIKGALNGNPFSYSHRIILTNGEEHLVHAKGESVFDEQNNPLRIRGITQDITERKRIEEALIHSEKHYRLLFETMLQGVVYQDADGKIISMNPAAERILGKTPAELLGSSSVGEEYHTIREDGSPFPGLEHPAMVSLRTGREVQNVVMGVYNPRENCYRWINVTAVPVFRTGEDKLFQVYTLFDDITERKKAEEEMAKFEIARKQEIHHRIKNNLQVISSLLDLQAEQFKEREYIINSEVMKAFKESQDRVISMALIHEELYKGGEIDTLNFSKYIMKLTENLLLTYRLDNYCISLDMGIEEDIFFDMDTAVPLGIIINELVSNSLKHAFKGRDRGKIKMKFHRDKFKSTSFTLSVSDNGIGIPGDIEIENLDSLGLQLVTTLVVQLDGELELRRNNGTEFIIRFTETGGNNQVLTPQLIE